MNRRLLGVAAAGVAAAFALALPLTAGPPGTSHNKSTDHKNTCDAGTVNVFVPDRMWPPNHKYVDDLFVAATATNPAHTVILESLGWHDQYDGDANTPARDEETNGAGNTGDDITSDDEDATVTKRATLNPDGTENTANESGYPEVFATESAQGSVTTDWKARAERTGRDQTGRQYTLSATATFSDGNSATTDPTCSKSVDFLVPHDMRKSTRS